MARVVQVNASRGGVPKRPLAEATIGIDGVVGDWQTDRRFHGGTFQALCLFPTEILASLKAEGYPVGAGSLGENLTTAGLAMSMVRIGDVYRAGGGVRFQITKPRGPCTTIQVYGDGIIKRLWGPRVPWGESGFYARVVEAGTVRAGDPLTLLRVGAMAPPTFTRKAELAVADFA